MPSLSRTVNSQQLTINKRRGFTLIELLVVITIIAVLIGAATVSYSNAQKKGRDSKRKADLKTIQQALELYFQENKYYPGGPQWFGWCKPTSHDEFKGVLVPRYINKVPADPLYTGTSKDYYYDYGSSVYKLGAVLENTNDPEYGTYNYSGNCVGAGIPVPDPYNYQLTPP